jgi:hypothetical protein
MTSTDDQYVERARQVGLFRYGLIREAADPALSTRQRGRLVGEIAAGEHVGPFGAPVRVSRPTVDRWIRIWRAGGFDALVPPPRRVAARTPAEVLALAVALKREAPARTATQVRAVLLASSRWAPHERTVQRHFVRLGLATRPDGRAPEAFGRFEAAEVNDLWTGDALHGRGCQKLCVSPPLVKRPGLLQCDSGVGGRSGEGAIPDGLGGSADGRGGPGHRIERAGWVAGKFAEGGVGTGVGRRADRAPGI